MPARSIAINWQASVAGSPLFGPLAALIILTEVIASERQQKDKSESLSYIDEDGKLFIDRRNEYFSVSSRFSQPHELHFRSRFNSIDEPESANNDLPSRSRPLLPSRQWSEPCCLTRSPAAEVEAICSRLSRVQGDFGYRDCARDAMIHIDSRLARRADIMQLTAARAEASLPSTAHNGGFRRLDLAILRLNDAEAKEARNERLQQYHQCKSPSDCALFSESPG